MSVRKHPLEPPEASVDRDADSAASRPAPVDHDLVARLRASYTLIRAQDLRFAELFYAKLFAAAPDLRELFHSHPKAQAAKLTATLDAIVLNLEAPEFSRTMLANLGRRHAIYGAKPEHFAIVIDLMIASMRELLRVETPDDQRHSALESDLEQWRIALLYASQQMIAAAEGARQRDTERDTDPPTGHGTGQRAADGG